MTSHFHHLRKTKKAKDHKNLSGGGHKLYGYNYGNDGYRHVVPYKLVQRWAESQVGRPINEVWEAAYRKWNNRTYIGQQTLDYLKFVLDIGSRYRYCEYYVENGILCHRVCEKYRRPKSQSKIVHYQGNKYFRHAVAWYKVEIKSPEPNQAGYYYFEDAFLGLIHGRYEWYIRNKLREMYGCHVYVTSKQQVGKRLCQKLNVLQAKPN